MNQTHPGFPSARAGASAGGRGPGPAGRPPGSVGRHPRFGCQSAVLWGALALFVPGCDTDVPFDHPKVASTAIAPSDETLIGRSIARWSADNDGASGFFMLLNGENAHGARLRLIERATRSIDAQYFMLKSDVAGSLFKAKLLRAADRGVRVRLLIDDVVALSGLDVEMALLDRHPGIEVRLFNPVSRDGFVPLNFLADFERANRRMHNKSFIADNAVTIVGGRNIGDEYFNIADDQFIDLDLMGMGPVAVDVSASFDRFWNDELSVPISAFGIATDDRSYAQFRRELEAVLAEERHDAYEDAVDSGFLEYLFRGSAEPVAATYDVVSDSPEKLKQDVDEALEGLGAALVRRIAAAREEVVILTPYLVPGPDGLAFLEDIRAAGVKVTLVTNSLASTDSVPVHSAYSVYREALLESGMELYELKSDALAVVNPDAPDPTDRLTLHTKAVIIDRETLFIGSMNFDPRSLDINSEMGIFLYSPEAAESFLHALEANLSEFTYRVTLDGSGDLVWTYAGGDQVARKTAEPDACAWRSVLASVLLLFPLEDQL